MEIILAENRELKKNLLSAMNSNREKEAEPTFLKGLLKDLYDCAAANCNRDGPGKRYPEFLKELGTMAYLLGGLQLYEFFASNLPLPSPSLARQVLYSTEVIEEGKIRMKELRHYLEFHNAPLQVFLSEDATRVTQRVLYHPGPNQIVGCTPKLDFDGCPMVSSFPATSADVIASYFSKYEMSNSAYVIMAQPMSGLPPFCLSIFGTDNKFRGSEVLKRWSKITSMAASEGIKIIGFASDGDTRLMQAMRCKTFVRNPVTPWKWFQANLVTSTVCFQDFVHLLVKLKSRLLKPSVILALGPNRLVATGHLVELIKTVPKEEHELMNSHLDSKDKMNFRTANKICSEKVTDLLDRKIVESEGTSTFLKMMRETFHSCADPSLAPLERIEIMWKWVIFVRIWRQWLLNQAEYSLGHNFISSNSYYCMELNAHALIQGAVMYRDEDPHLFKPWLCSSQPCESFFRSARSLTSTFSTVINFSILEMLHKIRRIEYLTNATFKLKGRYKFPRQMRAFEAIEKSQCEISDIPTNEEINFAVQKSLKKANELALKLNLITKPLKVIPPLGILIISNLDGHNPAGEDDDEDDCDEVAITGNEEEILEDSNRASQAMEEFDSDISSDVFDDLTTISAGCLKTFNNAQLSPSSSFVKVNNSDGGHCIIKKSTYCWLLSNGHTTLSNDRLMRVRAEVTSKSKLPANKSSKLVAPKPEEMVSVAEWCAFISEEDTVIIGRILAFRFMVGTTWKNQEYKGMTASVTGNKKELGVLCSWFNPKEVGQTLVLKSVAMDVQGYYNLANYICTIPRPAWEEMSLRLTCSLQDIMKFRN
ncbi:hypothetical protein FOCC_FOCC007260 [Frankliniella occidentalis]|nr:hypothetical protein FOCC_FOCC007260 [Frankliniella occidentalis]